MTSRGQEEWLAGIAQCESSVQVASSALASFEARFDAGCEARGVSETGLDNEYSSALALVDARLAREFIDVTSSCCATAARGPTLSPFLLRLCDEVGRLE